MNAWNCDKTNYADYFINKYKQEELDFYKNCDKNPPVDCKFKVGDIVTFTNEYGIEFPDHKVMGYCKDIWKGRFIYLDLDCYWMPMAPENLTLQKV